MVKKDFQDVEDESKALKDAETVAKNAPDSKTKDEAEKTAALGKQEDYHGAKVERDGKTFICREEKGSAGCGTVLKDEDELRNHLRHIHQKNIGAPKDDKTATQVNPATDFK